MNEQPVRKIDELYTHIAVQRGNACILYDRMKLEGKAPEEIAEAIAPLTAGLNEVLAGMAENGEVDELVYAIHQFRSDSEAIEKQVAALYDKMEDHKSMSNRVRAALLKRMVAKGETELKGQMYMAHVVERVKDGKTERALVTR